MKDNFDAYGEIKSRILSRTYLPGEKLSEARVAADLEVGRSPIRTALQRLEMEGWVIVRPQSGTVVSELGPEDVHEICELRGLLESHVIRKAAMTLSNEEIAELRHAHFRLTSSNLIHDTDAREDFNRKVFDAIYRCGDNDRILQVLKNLHDQVLWIRRINATDRERVRESIKELGNMIAALEARDPDMAAKQALLHVRNIAAAFEKLYRRKNGV